MGTSTKTPVGTVIVLFLALSLVLGGFIYSGIMLHIDRKNYSQNIADMAFHASAPATRRIINQGGYAEYENCERGFCWSGPDEESLKQVMEMQDGVNAGFPMIDTAAFKDALKLPQPDDR